MTMTIWDLLISGYGLVAIVGIFYPRFFWEIVYLGWEGRNKYDKKNELKYRIYALGLLLFGILLYILDRVYKG